MSRSTGERLVVREILLRLGWGFVCRMISSGLLLGGAIAVHVGSFQLSFRAGNAQGRGKS